MFINESSFDLNIPQPKTRPEMPMSLGKKGPIETIKGYIKESDDFVALYHVKEEYCHRYWLDRFKKEDWEKNIERFGSMSQTAKLAEMAMGGLGRTLIALVVPVGFEEEFRGFSNKFNAHLYAHLTQERRIFGNKTEIWEITTEEQSSMLNSAPLPPGPDSSAG